MFALHKGKLKHKSVGCSVEINQVERKLQAAPISSFINRNLRSLRILLPINRDSNKADMDILIRLLTALDMDLFTLMGVDVPAGAGADTCGSKAAL